MTSYSWNGASGSYLDPAQWTPNDVGSVKNLGQVACQSRVDQPG